MKLGQQIDGKKAKKLVEKGAVIIDVRNPVAFRDGNIPGSINLSLRQLSAVNKYPKNTKIIVVGDEDLATLNSSINYISLYGYQEVFSLGTIEKWNM